MWDDGGQTAMRNIFKAKNLKTDSSKQRANPHMFKTLLSIFEPNSFKQFINVSYTI